MPTFWAAATTWESALVSLPGCRQLPAGCGSQPRCRDGCAAQRQASCNSLSLQRICTSNLGDPRLNSRRISRPPPLSSSSPSSQDANPGVSADHSPDSSNSEEIRSRPESSDGVDGTATPETSNLDSFLPSRKEKTENAAAKPKANAAQSALERAAAYKKMKALGASSSAKAPSTPRPAAAVAPANLPTVEIVAGRPIQSSKASSSSSSGLEPPPSEFDRLTSSSSSSSSSSGRIETASTTAPRHPQSGRDQSLSAVPISDSRPESNSGGDVSAAALSAFEKALAYKVQQAEMVAALQQKKEEDSSITALPWNASTTVDEEAEKVVEVEIYTRDGIIKRRVVKPETAFANVRDIKRTGVSDMDFVGLGFADKKSSSGMPAGLSEAFAVPTGALPEVEIFTRDAGLAQPPMVEGEQEAADVYKPRVTTWGVFPRPADISKAVYGGTRRLDGYDNAFESNTHDEYGGGRNIKPGQKLETEEEKVAREVRTKKLLDEYRKKMGLDVDPKKKARCERTMKQGEDLMDRGRLREALVAFENVVEEMAFPSELHGLAALQGAVCLDSLNRRMDDSLLSRPVLHLLEPDTVGLDVGRSDDAKREYEKLVSHPNVAVRKKARQFLFGFQAAEKLKVRAGYNWDGSIYRKYFDAFADGYNTMYKGEDDPSSDDVLTQTLPYALLLIFPLILVFTLVALKNT